MICYNREIEITRCDYVKENSTLTMGMKMTNLKNSVKTASCGLTSCSFTRALKPQLAVSL